LLTFVVGVLKNLTEPLNSPAHSSVRPTAKLPAWCMVAC